MPTSTRCTTHRTFHCYELAHETKTQRHKGTKRHRGKVSGSQLSTFSSPMNPWQKLAAGQQLRGLSAKAYNAMLDAALAHSARGLNTGSGAELRMPDGTINIRNDTTYHLGHFAVVGLDQVLIGPDLNAHEFKYRFAMRGEIPSGSDHRGRFGILVNPLPQGQIGP